LEGEGTRSEATRAASAFWTLGRISSSTASDRTARRGLAEEVVAQFLDGHLPQCRCPPPVEHTRADLRAAFGHLLVVLRANAVIPERVLETTPVEEELRRFDAHMDQVRGLAAATRRFDRHIVRCFLLQQFGNDPVDLAAIKPEAVRRFITDRSTHYNSPAGVATLIAALRGYLRFRIACGDPVQALSAVLIAPRRWRQASLLLRHTMASRLLAGGSSIKEVADVLRHRSLETTQIYAKLDSRNLSTVALPWPGREA
jgi:integrase